MSLRVSFVRHQGKRDHVLVTRGDATTCEWAFPSYGEQLPHDLCHLVVEDFLRMPDGFWGLVERGMEVRLIDNQGTLVKDGRPIFEQAGFDASDLIRAEEAVALIAPIGMQVRQVGALAVATRSETASTEQPAAGSLSGLGFRLPAEATAAAVASVRGRLAELQREWASLPDGGSINLSFTLPHADS